MRRFAQYTCLAALIGATSIAAAAEIAGVAFVGDVDSVDKAVIEAAQLPLPQVGQGTAQPKAPNQVIRSPSNVAPTGFSMPVAAPTKAEPEQRESFFSRLKPKWPFGKKDEAKKPATDPFAAAAAKGLPSSRPTQGAVPIATRATTGDVEQVAYRRGLFDSAKQPTDPRSAAPRKPSQPGRSALTQAKPQGFFSTLWGKSPESFGANSSPVAKQSAAPRRSPSKPTGFAKQRSKTRGVVNNAFAQQDAQRSAMPARRPTPEAKSTPNLVVREAPAPQPLSLPSDIVEPVGEAFVINDKMDEPSFMTPAFVSDADSPKEPAVEAYPEAKAIVEATPQKEANPVVESLESPRAAEPTGEPVLVADKAEATPTTLPPVTEIEPSMLEEEPEGDALVASDLEQLVAEPRPGQDEPSERARALLAEAHGFAQTAGSYEDFSAIVKRCRYVLAIDSSKQATEYAHQLAGWALTKRGEALDESGRGAEAKIDYREALRCNAECWRAEHNLGVLAARDGDRDEALQRFNRTIDVNPEYAMAYANRAALSVQSGDYRAAMDDYQRAIDVDPDLAMAHSGRGRVCHMLGRIDEGLRHLDAAEILDPESATIAGGRADLLVDLGRYGQAKEAYERAIELDPQSPSAYRNLAWMQATCPVDAFRNGDLALANAAKAEELAGRPDDLTLDTKAAALAAVGRFGEASTVQQEAIAMAPAADAAAYRERLALYELGESFTSHPVATIQQTAYSADPSRTNR